jgi:hypothetical protein
LQDAQDELDEPVEDYPAVFIFQLIWVYQVAAKWDIKQDNSDQVAICATYHWNWPCNKGNIAQLLTEPKLNLYLIQRSMHL